MGTNNQGAFRGTNKLCQQCIKECEQFSNVKVIKCGFVSNQKKHNTLALAENSVCRGNDKVKAPNTAKASIGMSTISKDTLPLANDELNVVSTEGLNHA